MTKVRIAEQLESAPRPSFTAKQRQAFLEAAEGKCGFCNMLISEGEPYEIDHRRPLGLKGSNAKSNLVPMHERCHSIKTKADIAQIAKAKRQQAYHEGIKPKSKRPLKGRKFTGWRNDFTGEIVRRVQK